MLDLRPYQREAVDAVYRFLREKSTNPCVVIPTAGGKSLCLAQVAKDAVQKWGGRVLILAHVKELVEQNAAKIRLICPEIKVGVYSAGLDSRDTKERVIVAGIQSIYNKMDLFDPFDIVMIDEAHLIPTSGEGRYRTFLAAAKVKNPNLRLIGFTATPFRTEGGLICKPQNLLNEICYEIGIKDLINDGYISKITARAGSLKPDLEKLHIRAGEFVQDEVEKVMGEDAIVRTACKEISEYTADRKTCLIFCTSVEHCKKVAKLIAEFTHEECAIVTGDTPAERRSEIIARMRGECTKVDLFAEDIKPLKYCCNVAVMTTGTDIPGIDTVALLRPTNSAGLLIQMIGRGFRLSPKTGKTECLVLDYGRNLERFGPIDMINIKEPKASTGEPLTKECPKCRTILRLSSMLCPTCGYQFPTLEKERREHEMKAADGLILSGEVSYFEFDVIDTEYRVWLKRGAAPGAPKTVRVTYRYDLTYGVSEWLCPEHTGYARRKFEKWWKEHALSSVPIPNTAEEVIEHHLSGFLKEVKSVKVKRVAGDKYPEIVSCVLGNAKIEQMEDVTDEEIADIPF